MLNLPTIPKDLVSILLDDGTIAYKECTLEDAKRWKSEKKDFTMMDGSLVTNYRIRSIKQATDLEAFEVFVYPNLSVTVKNDFIDIRKSAIDHKQNPSLNAILNVLDKKKQEREYALSIQRERTPDELARRKQQAERIKARLSFSIQ